MKRLLSIMLLAAATTLTAQADKEIKRPDSYNYSRGVEAYDNDNPSEAIDYFNREVAVNKKNGYAYMYLADIYRQQEEPGKAIDAANLAIKYMPAKDKEFTTVSYTIRAQIQCLLKDTVAALSDYASAIKASPDEQRPYEERAQLYYEMERYNEADADYRKVIKIASGDATGYMGLGRNLSAQKQWTEAIKQFTYAASLGSDNAYPYAFRAEAYKELGEWDKSADDIITALSIEFNNKAVSLLSDIKDPMLSILLAKMKIQMAKSPNNIDWPFYLAATYEQSEQYAKAISYYKILQDKDASLNLGQGIARCYQKMGDYQNALIAINKACDTDSVETDVLGMRADILYNLNRPQESIQQYDEIIKMEPDNMGYYFARAWTKLVLRDFEGAIEDATMCMAAGGNELAPAYNLRGLCYKALNNNDKARPDLEKAIALEPTPADYSCSQYAYLELGQRDKAMEVMDTILNRDNNSGNNYDAACLYSLMNNTEKALNYFKTALEKGYVNFAHIGLDHDLDNIRQLPQFKSLVSTYKQKLEQSLTPADTVVAVHPNAGNTVTTEVPFTKEYGVCTIKCKINNLPLSFVFDTGAATVSLSMVEATFMMKNGYLSKSDVVGSQYFQDANGNINEGTIINLRHVDFGGLKLENVRASVVRNQRAPLLLGQSVLGRLGKIEIDNSRKVLTITSKQ
ncbi:tetratricopeptide repeat protein [Prevotellamassilia timonensis]|uniref:tetratricopeptide repeat protein n=1 Tax=Prevotellamassilia timonensis TaxID=1852370 RepID=UPI0023F091DB|nr:tetratricopeptide repeat protein [Prevotellamassilia timonensis]MDD7440349.1 tetratricopeptide repeat protein [Prevotellamassilia timonensis]